MQLRQCQTADRPVVETVLRAGLEVQERLNQITGYAVGRLHQCLRSLDSGSRSWWLAEEDSVPVGVMWFVLEVTQADPDLQPCSALNEMDVLPGQRRGVGTEMLDAAEQMARAAHKDQVVLEVHWGNRPARGFYAYREYELFGKHSRVHEYWPGKKVTMRKRLRIHQRLVN